MTDEITLDADTQPGTEGAPDPLPAAGPDEETTASTPAPQGEGRGRGRGRGRLALLVGGVVVIVGLAAALVISRVQLSNQDAVNADRASATAAARAYALDVATYDYRHLQHDFGRVEGESTPSFRRSFISSSNGLAKVLRQYKATASGKVLDAGVVSVSGSRAVVILFVNQSVANSTQSGTTTDNSRIVVTLQRDGDRWLLQDLKLV